MLRTNTKNQLIQLIEKISSICKKAITQEHSQIISILQESQDAIIAIGERLEKETKEESNFIIKDMELLCECFYQLSQDLDNRTRYSEQINILLVEILMKIEQLPSAYQIVFFPYKADMWDSLESVWLACKEDSLCDCKVVPIPYYHYNANTNEWEYRYEIDRFPDYVKVINYEDYDLTEGADAAFIHNPYDQYNHVTNVHSDYFSYNLKKYVKNLFYIPYYVTTGFIADDHKMLSAYVNADYLVVQSESFKEGLKDYPYYEKALVVGSPKLDCIIRLSGDKNIVPEDWKSTLEGKKSLMLNTSLNQFLYDGEAYLQKLKYLFDVAKTQKDVVIIWRPHPLLQSTIESMRPHLLKTYMELKAYFVNENIGIFDTTPDIINTVAVTDGYIGETSSSVVNLFEAAGKPLFILNNYIFGAFSKEEQRLLYLYDCEKLDNKMYCTSMECSSIFSSDKEDWSQMRKQADVSHVAKWMVASTYVTSVNKEMYLNPVWAEEFYSYDIEKDKVQQKSAVGDRNILNYRFVISYKDKVFYLPNNKKQILEYHTVTQTWKEHKAPIEALQKNITERIWEDVCGYFVKDNEIWMTTLYSNRILRFCMDTGNYQVYEIGAGTVRYSAIAVMGGMLYVSNACTGDIEGWDLANRKQVKVFTMPNSYQTFQNVQGRYIAHTRLFVAGNNLVAAPGTSNALVRVNLQTGKTEVLAKEFFADVLEPANNYKPQAHGIVTLAKMLDDTTLLIQKRRDASLLEMNVHTGEYQVHHPKLAEGELEQLLDGEDGFEKSYTNGEFARRESRYFSFEGFLDDLVHERFGDAMERQKEAMQTMAVNLDGTCGEKVHEFMMSVLG